MADSEQTAEAMPGIEVTQPDESPEAQTQPDESGAPVDEAPQSEPVPGDEATSEAPASETAAGQGDVTGEGEVTGEGAEAPQEGQEEESAPVDLGAPTDEIAPSGEAEESEGQVQEPGEQGEGLPVIGEQGEPTEEDVPVEAAEGEAQAGSEGGDQVEGEPAVSVAEGEQTQGVETAEGQGQPDDGDQPPSPVIQSDTFAEGERPESPGMAVGERLSREGSPTEQLRPNSEHTQPEPLEPGTPDRVSEAGDEVSHPDLLEQDEEEEDEDEEPEIDREQLIERYHAAIAERDQLQQQNYQLQHKIAEYFRKKKSDDSRQDFDKNISDQEQRYIKYMANLEELRKQEGHERENYQIQIEELKNRCQDKQKRVDDERERFMEFKKQVALNSMNSRSGKPIPPKDIEQYLSSENRKDSDVVTVRLENIKLKNKLKKKEQQLKSKEELAEGLHLIDFEQLKIENQTYNEKIEERNEELLKLRKKITSTVQVLTHLKEKLQFVQAENHVQNGRLKEVESTAAKKRDILSRTKQARDALRIDNQKLRQNSGLLGNEPLLRDFEDRRDESDDLTLKLEQLKMQHAELTLNCNQVRRKIDQVRMSQS